MAREFIATPVFDKRWDDMKLNDDNLRELQSHLIQYPDSGNIIQGTSGARKIRYALFNTGKSGGIRVIYFDRPNLQKTNLLLCYPKSVQEDLTPEQKKIIKKLVETLKGERK